MFNWIRNIFYPKPPNNNIEEELEKRIQLFPQIDEQEVERRSK